MPDTSLSFEARRGDRLRARLEMPADRDPTAVALFAHGLPDSGQGAAARQLAEGLARAGIATLGLGFHANDTAAGIGTEDAFPRVVDDLLDAAAFLEQHYAAPRLLIGHGQPGAALLQAAGSWPQVRAVATVAVPYLDGNGMRDALHGLRRPLLVLHSPVDAVVDVDNARRIFEAALHPKSFVSLHRADHLLSGEGDARFAGDMIACWAAPLLGSAPAPDWRDAVADDRTVVRTAAGLRTEAVTNGFRLTLDEPVRAGGTNTGPNPYDLLGASLASCTSMTLRLYADRKGWPLESVTVEVGHRKVTVEEAPHGEGKPRRIDVFERRIQVEGPLDEAQRQRLLEIANRCPVHRTLTSEVRVESRLVGTVADTVA